MDQEPGVNPGLSREQKTGFVLLLLFAVLAVGLGVLQIRNTIYGPFVVSANDDGGQVTLVLDENTQAQQIDTDQDGLTDYEEKEFYETSPYLPDTDSDGVLDKAEIEAGGNPLCAPENDACQSAADVGNATPFNPSILPIDSALPTGILGGAPVQEGGSTSPSASTLTLEDLGQLVNDPVTLRAVLLESGQITKAQLDAIPDATLLQFASQLQAESGRNNPPGASTATNTTR